MAIQKFYSLDAELLFRDAGSAAVTTTGYVGTQKDLKGAVLTEGAMIVNLEALDVANGDELYTFRVVASQTADRSDARVIGIAEVGDAAAKAIDTADDVAGEQVVIQFQTHKAAENARYLDLHLTTAGTTPSITFSAFATLKA